MSPETILLRQAHPNFMDGPLITSQVFMPFPKDEGKLSVYDGDQITAADAYEHYTETLGNESHSIWAVTKGEADGLDVPASPDPLPAFLSHSVIDFTGRTDKDSRKIAKRLKLFALGRGCLYAPA